MDARAQSSLLLAIVALALAASILLRPARSRLFTRFALLNTALFAWSLAQFFGSLAPLSLWPARLASAAEFLLPAVVLGFVLEFLGEERIATRRTLQTALTIGVLGTVGAMTRLALLRPDGWSLTPLRIISALYCFGGLAMATKLLHSRMKRSVSRTERARLLYLLVGAGLSLGLTAMDVLARGIPFPPLGTVATTVYLYFLSQTLLRHRLLDLNELLGKFMVLSLLAVLLAAIYGVLVSWSVGITHDQESWAGLFLFNTLVASFVILILFDPLRTKIESTVVALLFRERHEFLQTLRSLRARVAALIDVGDLTQLLLDTLYETRRMTHASLYLMRDDGLGFRRSAFRGPAPVAHLDAAPARALVNAAAAGQRAVLVENIERRLFELRSLMPGTIDTATAPALPPEAGEEALQLSELGLVLGAMRAGVCIPLVGGDRVLGFLNLHDDRVPEAFASDEIAAMLDLAEQVAVTIDNSRLYERMKERDRLAALGEMAAGLAHEIRNPLSSIKGAVQYLDPDAAPGADRELVEVIVEEVNRLNAVVTQFLDYSRPLRSTFQKAHVNDVLTKTLRLLEGRELPPAIRVQLDLEQELPVVHCDADQLKQVFINLAMNAAQAMPAGGTLTVSTRRPRANEWLLAEDAPRWIGDQVEVRFGDTGPGISEEVRQRIFIPFFTTKEKGTGLGLAICQRIVKNHGGSIEVESRPGDGTTFIIRLPTNADRPTPETTPVPRTRPLEAPAPDERDMPLAGAAD